jgi:hypothetical protein
MSTIVQTQLMSSFAILIHFASPEVHSTIFKSRSSRRVYSKKGDNISIDLTNIQPWLDSIMMALVSLRVSSFHSSSCIMDLKKPLQPRLGGINLGSQAKWIIYLYNPILQCWV